MSKVPTNDEFLQLMRRWNASDCEAEKNEIATTILKGLNRLIWMLIRRRGNYISESLQDDCYSEACLAIVRQAIPNFKEEKMGRAKFSNYCANWVTSSISRYLNGFNSVVAIPHDGRKKAMAALNEGKELTAKQRAYLPSIVYWDKEATNDESANSRTLMEVMCETEGVAVQPEAFDNIDTRQREALANKFLSEIDSDRDRAIVLGRLEGRTLQELGSEAGVSRERARQIYTKQLKLMQQKAKFKKQSKVNAKYERRKKSKAKRVKVIDKPVKRTETIKERDLRLCKEVLSRRSSIRAAN